jgi:hypothetical protein
MDGRKAKETKIIFKKALESEYLNNTDKFS